MFIKKIIKSNKNPDKSYTYYRLIESYRTPTGPRHRNILNLGKLDIPEDEFKLLADRIEEIITGVESLFPVSPHIETLSQHYAKKIIKNNIKIKENEEKEEGREKREYLSIDPNSTKIQENRSIGGEHIALTTIKSLKFDKYLQGIGFSEKQINAVLLNIIGRLLCPGSEKKTLEWVQRISGLGDLLGVNYNSYGKNILYRVSDKLYEHKKEIEKYLSKKSRDLFSLKETIILYDLTNTFFEGGIRKSELKRRGHSKEKRSDAPLVTLGLILDENGFPKASKIFKGNIGEPETLSIMLDELKETIITSKSPTVVMDAGIVTEDNLKMIREKYKYDYIVVSRKKLDLYKGENFITIKDNKKNKIEAYLYKSDEESVLYCRSKGKLLKEESIAKNLKRHFEKELEKIKSSLKRKGGTKRYEKIIERIGRVKERHSKISRFYAIDIKSNDKKMVTDISYEIFDKNKIEKRFSGSYYLRTSRVDLNEEEIWNIYIMLTDVESSFRVMKSELGLRPVNHQKDLRIEGHLFITVIAYHIQKIIRYKLKMHSINDSWNRIRLFMSTHEINIITQDIENGGKLYIKKCSEPEKYQREIYEALRIKEKPLSDVIMVTKPKKKGNNL